MEKIDHADSTQEPKRTLAPGWSAVSKRRARGRSHPLGGVTAEGDGYTEYSDDFTGHHGTVQIWDES